MSDQAALERRYRRMLIWFPAEHRRIYGEEMIGVLLASTPSDQDRPNTAAAIDLIGGGLRARFRRLRTGDDNVAWRDALALFSVVAPFVLFVQQAAGVFGALDSRFQVAWLPMLTASALVLAAAVAGPALARRDRYRTVTAIALIAAAVAVVALIQTIRVDHYAEDTETPYNLLILIMEVVAVAISPGPRRGWQLLGRKGLIILGSTAIAMMFGGWLELSGGNQVQADLANNFHDLAPIAGLAGLAIALRWRTGSRLLALFAIPGYMFVGFNLVTYVYPIFPTPTYVILEVTYLPTAAIAVLVATAAWWSGRRRPQIPGSSG